MGEVTGFDVKHLSLIDISFEDDRLIDTSPDAELLYQLDLDKADEEAKRVASESIGSFQERSSKTPENYLLRKSLAWDTAFFSSDGFLEPEEFTSMIEDAGKKANHKLPMILEETQRSTKSISTLASDTLTFESLEADLFDNTRASTQKSTKTFNIQTSGRGTGQSSSGEHAHHTLRKSESTSLGKLKPKPAKNSNLSMIRQGKKTNQVPVHRRVSQVPSVAEGVGSSSLPSKPPKPGLLNPIPSSKKKDSLGPSRMKPKKNNIKEAKLSVSRATRSVVPRPSTSSSLAHAASVKTKIITPSSDSLTSSSHDKSKRTSGNLSSKAFGPKSRKSSSASSSMLGTLPRSNPSGRPSHLRSTTSTTDPSTSSTVKQRSSDSRTSFQPSSSGKSSDGPKSRGHARSNLQLKNASTGKAPLLPDSMRPSSLGMPSLKIGFFDGMKSGRASNAAERSPHVAHIGPPKVRADTYKLDGSMNKANLVKSQPARATTSSNNMKGDTKQFFSVGKHKSLSPESEYSNNSAENVHSASRNVNHSSPHIFSRGLSRAFPKSGHRNGVKAKEADKKTCDDKKRPEVKPISDAGSRKTNATGRLRI